MKAGRLNETQCYPENPRIMPCSILKTVSDPFAILPRGVRHLVVFFRV